MKPEKAIAATELTTKDGITTYTYEGLEQGLYFCGEVIDVDAYTGGFNLQIAFSTARLAAENAIW